MQEGHDGIKLCMCVCTCICVCVLFIKGKSIKDTPISQIFNILSAFKKDSSFVHYVILAVLYIYNNHFFFFAIVIFPFSYFG